MAEASILAGDGRALAENTGIGSPPVEDPITQNSAWPRAPEGLASATARSEDAEPLVTQQPGDTPDSATAQPDQVPTIRDPEIVGDPAIPPVRSLRSLIESELISLRRHHHQVLESGEVEAIHKMRVVTRRLQAALDLLEFRPDHLKVRSLKKKVRRWRRSLSRVRNYDVFLAIVEKEALARRPGGRRPYELMQAELEKRRARNMRKSRCELEHINVAGLAARLGLILEPDAPYADTQEMRPGNIAQSGTPSRGLNEAAPLLIDDEGKIAARAFERLRQRLAEFQARALSTHAAEKPAAIHRLRIAAKRLRYLIEALSQMGYGDASRALEWLKVTQDRLGDLHDLEAFRDEIVLIASRPRFVKKHMGEAGEMLQAASRFLARRENLRSKLLPLRVPPVLGAASSRLTRSMTAATPRHSENAALDS